MVVAQSVMRPSEMYDPGMSGRGYLSSWAWFALWCVVGAGLAFLVLVFGTLALPVVICVVLMVRFRAGPRLSAVAGLITGIGVWIAGIGARNLDYHPCMTNDIHGRGFLPAGANKSVTFSCGGIDGHVWLIIGAALLAAGLLMHGLRSRPTRPPRAPGAWGPQAG